MIKLNETVRIFLWVWGSSGSRRTVEGKWNSTTPYLPNLVQEGKVGFDAALKSRGIPILLQFKLGESPSRLVKGRVFGADPKINKKKFWRYGLDPYKANGQFQILLGSEAGGAVVCYVAPYFTDWTEYVEYFETNSIIKNSMCVAPSCILDALDRNVLGGDKHLVVYDKNYAYARSKYLNLQEYTPIKKIKNKCNLTAINQLIGERIDKAKDPVKNYLRDLSGSLDRPLDCVFVAWRN